MLPGRRVKHATVCIPGGGASDRASRSGTQNATKTEGNRKQTSQKENHTRLRNDHTYKHTYDENIDYVGVTKEHILEFRRQAQMKMKQFTKVRTCSSSCVLYRRSRCVLLFVESVKRTAYRVMEGVGLRGTNLKRQ